MQLPFPLSISLGLLSVIAIWLFYVRGRALLMFFQQEEYHYSRFAVWWTKKLAFDRLASGLLITAFLMGFISLLTAMESIGLILFVIGFVAILAGIWVSYGALKKAKKPLVMTARASRIHLFFISYNIVFVAVHVFTAQLLPLTQDAQFGFYLFLLMLQIQCMPFTMMLADFTLKPMENRVKKRFLNDAKNKLAVLSPQIIAITGSFGKTSTKQILNHILSSVAPTLATPGSVNTEMGITRIIREQLSPAHKYFIVEMGAYGPGSIARLCKLTPPHAAMITAVGNAHYERFKTLETVAKAKFEIAEATLKQQGPVIVSELGIPAHLRKERIETLTKAALKENDKATPEFILVGPDGTISLKEMNQGAYGIEVVLEVLQDTDKDGKPVVDHIPLRAPLFGLHQAENVALAASLANRLGVPWGTIKAALTTAPQIRHRLEVTRVQGQPTILDDAYNSNPIGFKSALDVLGHLIKPGGKRICITPGMVELGDVHDAEHFKLGKIAAEKCDLVCVVTPERIKSFVDGLNSVAEGAHVEVFATQSDAEAYAKAQAKEGDAILFENNLPDLYEQKVRF